MPPLTCTACKRSFSKKEHYVRHVRVHTHERPFACQACDAKFARRDTLKRHVASHHAEAESTANESVDLEPPTQVGQDGTGAALQVQDAGGDFPVDDALFNFSGSPTVTIPPNANGDPAISPELPSSAFNWQWDASFELGPDFNIADFGTHDAGDACPSMPWLPLHTQTETRDLRPSTPRPMGGVTTAWFSRVPVEHRGKRASIFSQPSDLTHQTELSRAVLTESLQQRMPEPLLPPMSLLNRSIHTYTTKLWPLIPVVHLPSFVPSQAHPLLLLSICSLGALAEGSEESLRHAFRLYEAVQKAILVSWDPANLYDPASLALVQAATIGQTFALLSPKNAHLATARAFHGTLCVVSESFQGDRGRARATGAGSETPSLDEEWQKWTAVQTCLRIANALQCHDGELAATYQRRPMMRTPPLRTFFAAPDNVYLAKTAEQWCKLVDSGRHTEQAPHKLPQRYSAFSSCAFLGSTLAEILDIRAARPDVVQNDLDKIEIQLIDWLASSLGVLKREAFEKLAVRFLLHSCFIQLLCDFDDFERLFGRDEEVDIDALRQHVREWATTDAAQRCVVHALNVSELVAQLRLADIPAIHVARTLFQAAVVLAVYAISVPEDFASLQPGITTRYAELQTMNSSDMLFQAATGTQDSMAEHCKLVAFSLSSTLRNFGPWPNAPRFAGTLDLIFATLES